MRYADEGNAADFPGAVLMRMKEPIKARHHLPSTYVIHTVVKEMTGLADYFPFSEAKSGPVLNSMRLKKRFVFLPLCCVPLNSTNFVDSPISNGKCNATGLIKQI